MHAMGKDYYETLGVSEKATKAEIKKAYRSKAKEHHPDKGGDEAKFKKINEAYETLSDDNKKAHYDQFGSGGPQFGGGGGGFSGFGGGQNFSGADFGGFEDIFSNFFGGGKTSSTRRDTRGSDMELNLTLSFDEAMNGVKKTFVSKMYVECAHCKGQGGEGSETCKKCSGSGHISQKFQTPFGIVNQQVKCPDCDGEGKTFKKKCSDCSGEGRVEKKNKVEVTIPTGVDDGETLRLSGAGEKGRRGGGRGDLYVHIKVESSKYFERRNLDLITELEISVFDAILGGIFEVKTFWGKVDLHVSENARDGDMLRIRGKGVKKGHYVGDHIVRIKYKMPKKVSKKLKELLEEAKEF